MIAMFVQNVSIYRNIIYCAQYTKKTYVKWWSGLANRCDNASLTFTIINRGVLCNWVDCITSGEWQQWQQLYIHIYSIQPMPMPVEWCFASRFHRKYIHTDFSYFYRWIRKARAWRYDTYSIRVKCNLAFLTRATEEMDLELDSLHNKIISTAWNGHFLRFYW